MVHLYVLIEGTVAPLAKEIIRKFNVKLLEQLPLDNPIFFGLAKKADLFPLGVADSITAKSTRAEKVAYLLQHVIEPGADDYLPKLLKVMKESKNDSVIKLANDIQAEMEPGTHS